MQKLVQAVICEPSMSPWATDAILAVKKDAKASRHVCDYWPLKKKLGDDQFPLGNIRHHFDTIGPCSYFSSLDLAQDFSIQFNSIQYNP